MWRSVGCIAMFAKAASAARGDRGDSFGESNQVVQKGLPGPIR